MHCGPFDVRHVARVTLALASQLCLAFSMVFFPHPPFTSQSRGIFKRALSTLPADTPIKELVRLAKLRWRIERDYQELKQELGLGHFEGRSWRGFHHHATLCIAAYGFLVTERLVVQKKTPAHRLLGEVSSLPEGFRPRGATA
ncbi:transposase [Ralstonia solanacearum]|uniref:transposase n=1 Tax=Ralstonia solanacearum TaxID=305 RepID=UPI003CC54BE1